MNDPNGTGVMMAEASVGDGTGGSWYERNWRWFVLATLFLATFLNYLDRQTLGNAAKPICEEFGLDNEQRGAMLAAFVYSYAFCHLFIGFILDRIRNIRLFFPFMVIGWSLSNMAVGFVESHSQIVWLRYLLGVWESANFPLCLMLIARIFPARERSLAAGIFNSGAFLAALVAPKLVIYISTEWNWRYSFIATGSVGILWLIPWFLIFRWPERRAINWPTEEKARTETPQAGFSETLTIFGSPAFWGVVLAGVGIVPCLYFVTQWLPSYLTQAKEMPFDQGLGDNLTLIYLSLDCGLWLSGACVWGLARRGVSVLGARKMVIAVGYCLLMCMLLVPQTASVLMTVALLCTGVFGLGLFLANQQAFKQDVAFKRVATVAALVGAIETGFSAFVIEQIGKRTKTQPELYYDEAFLLLAALFTLGVVAVFALLRPRWIQVREGKSPPG